ncbi:MAG: U32 family peptidase [Spirochaetales bacterium]|nr:U32 family peptidase [Spirochaetales bacterium]
MAPVGSYESLMAAIQGGADSVYFGVEQLNMRARSAHNFSTDDLKKIVSIAQEHGVKTYLTLNIVVFDHEMELLHQIIDLAKAVGLSAVIASDQAAILYARKVGVEVHISTQVNITNTEAVRFYAQYAEVMVLARELSLDQVSFIHDFIEREKITGPKGQLVQIEMFCHGALCMATSGKCYLSLHQYNYSANRGACLQGCRRKYLVTDKESGDELEIDNEYLLSPKDLKTVHFLNKMLDSGVRVFKIEGRARSSDYVKTVVQCYNEALLAVLDGSFSQEKIADWDNRMSKVFNRGFWDGYYLGQRTGEWTSSYGSSATHKKVYVGKSTNYFDKLGVAEFFLESGSLKLGDEILITGPTTGAVQLVIAEMRTALNPVETALKGEAVSIPVADKIRRNDKLYKLVPTKKE